MFTKIKTTLLPYRTKLAILGVVILALFIWHPFARDGITDTVEAVASQQSRSERAFGNIDTSSLSPARQRVFTIIQQEYDKNPKYFDDAVMTYTEGIRESWCADFISWTYLQADTQLVNPHSGYWRIPGVLTLQTYFRDNGAYTSVDSGYIPKLGDVAFYIGSQTPDNTSDEHAAFVIAVNGDQITTLGGNEGTGVMRLRTETIQQNKDKGLVGYGQLEL